jgi:hypothetical protein
MEPAMPTKVKIKIDDIPELRNTLDALYEKKTQVEIAQWALMLAEHILEMVGYDYVNDPAIQEGFRINRQWQAGTARIYDIRQMGFRVHQQAKTNSDPVVQAALRVAGQAIGTGHMREHAMVASDYAIKTINLKHPGSVSAVKKEREWQINAFTERYT